MPPRAAEAPGAVPARLVAGGERTSVDGKGNFVTATLFADVDPGMRIAQEEIFGPVAAIIPFEDEEDAVRIANDTVYGLSAYISGSAERAKAVASKLRAGNVHLNGAGVNPGAPFGGYKQSGNGREFSVWGLEEFLETKAVIGFDAA